MLVSWGPTIYTCGWVRYTCGLAFCPLGHSLDGRPWVGGGFCLVGGEGTFKTVRLKKGGSQKAEFFVCLVFGGRTWLCSGSEPNLVNSLGPPKAHLETPWVSLPVPAPQVSLSSIPSAAPAPTPQSSRKPVPADSRLCSSLCSGLCLDSLRVSLPKTGAFHFPVKDFLSRNSHFEISFGDVISF